MQTPVRCYPALFRDDTIVQVRATLAGNPEDGAHRVYVDLFDPRFETSHTWAAGITFDHAVEQLTGQRHPCVNLLYNAARLDARLRQFDASAFVLYKREIEFVATARPPSGVHPHVRPQLHTSCDPEAIIDWLFGLRN